MLYQLYLIYKKALKQLLSGYLYLLMYPLKVSLPFIKNNHAIGQFLSFFIYWVIIPILNTVSLLLYLIFIKPFRTFQKLASYDKLINKKFFFDEFFTSLLMLKLQDIKQKPPLQMEDVEKVIMEYGHDINKFDSLREQIKAGEPVKLADWDYDTLFNAFRYIAYNKSSYKTNKKNAILNYVLDEDDFYDYCVKRKGFTSEGWRKHNIYFYHADINYQANMGINLIAIYIDSAVQSKFLDSLNIWRLNCLRLFRYVLNEIKKVPYQLASIVRYKVINKYSSYFAIEFIKIISLIISNIYYLIIQFFYYLIIRSEKLIKKYYELVVLNEDSLQRNIIYSKIFGHSGNLFIEHSFFLNYWDLNLLKLDSLYDHFIRPGFLVKTKGKRKNSGSWEDSKYTWDPGSDSFEVFPHYFQLPNFKYSVEAREMVNLYNSSERIAYPLQRKQVRVLKGDFLLQPEYKNEEERIEDLKAIRMQYIRDGLTLGPTIIPKKQVYKYNLSNGNKYRAIKKVILKQYKRKYSFYYKLYYFFGSIIKIINIMTKKFPFFDKLRSSKINKDMISFKAYDHYMHMPYLVALTSIIVMIEWIIFYSKIISL